MKFSDLKIRVRLGLLGGFFLIASLLVAGSGWRALDAAAARSAARRAAGRPRLLMLFWQDGGTISIS